MPLRRHTLILLSTFLGVGCSLTPRDLPEGTMPKQTSALIGTWEKSTQSACSQLYPQRLRFDDTGNYYGQPALAGGFTLWDVGTFDVVEPTRVKLSTANDAVVAYAFSLSSGVLTFTDAQGCAVSYRKG